MSAAQAVTSGLPASASGPRPSRGGSSTESSDTSFRDTLDGSTRSSEGAAADKAAVAPEIGKARADDAGDSSRDGSDTAGRDGERPQRGEAAAVADLSAMLAVLGGASVVPAPDNQADAATALAPSPSTGILGSNTAPADDMVWLPGQVEGDGEVLDAQKLLRLLTPGAAGESAPKVPVDTVDVSYAVAGSETHLALETVSAKAQAMLSPTRDAGAARPAPGDIDMSPVKAALAQAAAPSAPASRAASVSEDSGARSDAVASARVVSLVPDGDSQAGVALADQQDIAGQQGRSAEGRSGSSSTSSQPQGTAAFLSALASAATPAAEFNGDAAGAEADPVSTQIASEVRAELKADGLGGSSSDGVLKVLSIELKPANLGSVTVRLALKDNAITVHIETQRHETLVAIEKEREALVGALTAAGYSIDGITTGAQGDGARSQGTFAGLGQGGASASQGGPQGQAGQNPGSSPGGQGHPSDAGGGNSGYRRPSDNNDGGIGGVRKDADALYV